MGSYLNYGFILFLMFLINYQIIFIFILILSTLITITFSSLMFSWIIIELNLLIIIPLLLIKTSYRKEQPSLLVKYFIVQVLGSLIIIFSFLLTFKTSLISIESTNIIIILILIMKSGTPPLHFWFPNIIKQRNYVQAILILNIQKIIPIFLLSTLLQEKIIFLVVFSSLISRILGLNQNKLMKILAYSSIVHFSWIISGRLINLLSFLYYFIIYTLVNFIIIKFIQKNKLKFISNLTKIKFRFDKLIFCFIILTLSGTPPFIGFFNKIFILFFFINKKLLIISLLLIFRSVISFYFYLLIISILIN